MTIVRSISFQEEQLEAIENYISKDYSRSKIIAEAIELWLEKQKKALSTTLNNHL